MAFPHLKMSCTQRIYTFVWVFLIFFYWRIFTSVRVGYNHTTLENAMCLKNIHLCPIVFSIFSSWISTFVRVDKNCVFTLENVIYLINIHLCMNVFQFFHWRMSTFVCVDKNGVSYTWICFYLKNIHLCTSWLNWCFLHWKIFSTWRTYSSWVSVSLKGF